MFSPNPANSISRTVQYRKITKPLLERKRRARINRCLDELKDLMFTALEAEGENVDKLEKADILEFTVKHLQKITRRDPVEEAYKFQEGFSHCASEACSFLLSLPGLDSVVGRRLVEYLAKSVSRALESQLPSNKLHQQQQHPAAAGASISPPAPVAMIAAAAVAAASNNINNNQNIVNNNNQNNNQNMVVDDDRNMVTDSRNMVADHANPCAEAIARGHTPPSSVPPTPCAALPLPPAGPGQLQAAGPSPLPLHKPLVTLTASNRGPAPHTVVRPKPTRPAFGRSASSSPPNVTVAAAATAAAAAAAAAAQRDPMWRPW